MLWVRVILICLVSSLFACSEESSDLPESAKKVVLKGEITYRDRASVPDGAQLLLQLININKIKTEREVIAEKTVSLRQRQPPIGFDLSVYQDQLNDVDNFSLRASIRDEHKETLWTTDKLYLVTKAQAEQNLGLLNVVKLRDESDDKTRQVKFQCDSQSLDILIKGQTLQLQMGESIYQLAQEEAASGVKYVSQEGLVSFWNKDNVAMLKIADNSWNHCTQVNDDKLEVLPLDAKGFSPDWQLSAGYDRFIMTWDEGKKQAVLSQPRLIISETGFTVTGHSDTRTINVVAEDKLCRDSHSAHLYPYNVKVKLDSHTFEGCGGQTKRLLQGKPWTVIALNNKSIINFTKVSMSFGPEGLLSGSASCNHYSTAYEFEEQLDIKTVITTRKLCDVALMNQEKDFLDVLTDVESIDFDENNDLVMTTADGRTLTARR